MATLAFDAYAMQGNPGRTSLFWARSVTNEARQRMIYTTALAAYRWALQRTDIDTRRIYLFGISNGAAVVANLAAVVDPAHVKGVISEGVTPIGLGLPDEIRVPVLLAFGREDDLGAKLGQRRWEIADPCQLNAEFAEAPPGTSRRCSDRSNPAGRMPTTLQWLETLRLREQGAVRVRYFDGVAHGAFLGPLTVQTAGQFARSRGFYLPDDVGWSEGATDEGRAALLAEALGFFRDGLR